MWIEAGQHAYPVFGVLDRSAGGSFGWNGWRHLMNLEPAATNVVVEDVGHIDHSGVVNVELAHSQHPRQLDPFHEHRRRNVAERDGDAHSELDVRFSAHRALDRHVDGGLGAAVGDDRHVRRHRLGARKSTRKHVLDVGCISNDITARSTDNVDYYSRDVRFVLLGIPHLTVVSLRSQFGDTEDADPRHYSGFRSVVIERRVQHQLVLDAVLDLPGTVSSYGVRQWSPQVTTWVFANARSSVCCFCSRLNGFRVRLRVGAAASREV